LASVYGWSGQGVGAAKTLCFSLDAAAEGDAIADGELADLDALVGGERLVELEHEVAIVADVPAHGRVGGEHDGAVPERVVVADEAAHLDELQQALVVAEVVVLVGVHEDEVEGAVVGLLRACARTRKKKVSVSRAHCLCR
jgi:hypothetical protein